MKELKAEITIGNNRFRNANSVSIEKSWKEVGDTAKIQLPNLKGRLERGINTGEAVTIRLGYAPNLRTEFRGFVSNVKPTIPFEVECEDQFYDLKREEIQKSWKSIQLRDLIAELVPDATLSDSIPDMNLSPFRIKQATKFDALEKLKKEYSLAIYYREGILFAGLPYTEFSAGNNPADREAGRFAFYNFQRNVAKVDLAFQRADDVKIKVKATSFLKNNKKLTVEVGDPDGETRSLFFQGIENEDALRKAAEDKIEQLRYSGYRGSLTTFGEPYVVHGATVSLKDELFPERAGRYLVDKVSTTWSTSSGFRRKLKLGPKI